LRTGKFLHFYTKFNLSPLLHLELSFLDMASKTRRPVAMITPPRLKARSAYTAGDKQSLLDNFDLEGSLLPFLPHLFSPLPILS